MCESCEMCNNAPITQLYDSFATYLRLSDKEKEEGIIDLRMHFESQLKHPRAYDECEDEYDEADMVEHVLIALEVCDSLEDLCYIHSKVHLPKEGVAHCLKYIQRKIDRMT